MFQEDFKAIAALVTDKGEELMPTKSADYLSLVHDAAMKHKVIDSGVATHEGDCSI